MVRGLDFDRLAVRFDQFPTSGPSHQGREKTRENDEVVLRSTSDPQVLRR